MLQIFFANLFFVINIICTLILCIFKFFKPMNHILAYEKIDALILHNKKYIFVICNGLIDSNGFCSHNFFLKKIHSYPYL